MCKLDLTARRVQMNKRKNHAPVFKAKAPLLALFGEKTVAELSSEFSVHQTRIYRWVKQLKEPASGMGIFSGETKAEEVIKRKRAS